MVEVTLIFYIVPLLQRTGIEGSRHPSLRVWHYKTRSRFLLDMIGRDDGTGNDSGVRGGLMLLKGVMTGKLECRRLQCGGCLRMM
jgi:hypothetical protein